MKYNSLFDLYKAFPDEEACAKHLEELRWPSGIVCPHCGRTRKFHRITRGNIYKCADCEKEFSVRKGTIFEESRLPLQKWFAATWLITANRKGISSLQLSREIGVTQKTAWFMLARLREVASSMNVSGGPMDGTIEADETYVGGKEKNKHASHKMNAGRGVVGKTPVIGAVERNGRVTTAIITSANAKEVHDFIRNNVNPNSTVYSDEHRSYLGLIGFKHESVNHSAGEYVNGKANTNTIESFWSLLKRGHYGIFHMIGVKHLHRYLAEFVMRWNMKDLREADRIDTMLESTNGLRLTYRGLIA